MAGNLRSDVAIAYGIDPGRPGRIGTWRDQGYRIHVMTGVSWGKYQDYLYGRFNGVNHVDAAQTDRQGNKISHGGNVYYMCPEINYGKFLCLGVQRALTPARRPSISKSRVLGPRRLFRGIQARMEDLFRRRLAAPARLGRRPVAGVEVEVLSLPPRFAASV